jgi:hypothetical protein
MIQLDDERWKEFDGGYRMPYDASVPLRRLEQASTPDEIDAIFAELWNELHHQGDIGLASYFAVPHLIRIAKEKRLFNFNVFGLVATIEIERHKDNPPLPKEFEAEYLQSLKEGIPELVEVGLTKEWDLTLASTVLSSLAASKGHITMADAISKMEDKELINDFLENF